MKVFNSIRRCLAVILSMAVFITAMPSMILHAEETEQNQEKNPTVYVNDIEIGQGCSNTLFIYVKDFENISAMDLSVYYDSAICTVTTVEKGWNLTESTGIDSNISEAGVVKLKIYSQDSIVSDMGYESSMQVLCQLQLQIKADAEVGKYPISLVVGEVYDKDLAPVEITRQNGNLKIVQSGGVGTDSHLYYSQGYTQSSTEDVLTYTMTIYDMNYLAGGNINFCYNIDDLAFKEIRLGNALKKESVLAATNTDSPGTIRLTFASDQSLSDEMYGSAFLEIDYTILKVEGFSTVLQTVPTDLKRIENEAIQDMSADELSLTVSITDRKNNLYAKTEKVSDGYQVIIGARGGSGLAAADFSISYDSMATTCTAVEIDKTVAENGGTIITNETIGQGSVRFSFVNAEGIQKDQDLVLLKFTSIGDMYNSACITVNANDAANSKNESIMIPTLNLNLVKDQQSQGSVYSITYEMNGGENHPSNPSSFDSTLGAVLYEPSRAGYRFTGWYTDVELKNKITGINIGTKGNIILYAGWESNSTDPTDPVGPTDPSDPVGPTDPQIPCLALKTKVLEDGYEVVLGIKGKSGLAAADFEITYDKTAAKCTSLVIDPEVSTSGATIVTNETIDQGSVRFSYINAAGLSKDQNLVTMKFSEINAEYEKVTLLANICDPVDVSNHSIMVMPASVELVRYYRVEDIIEVPSFLEPGQTLFLTGKILPETTTFRTIHWSIKDAGETGATLSDGAILTASKEGEITLIATVEKGLSEEKDFVKEFKIVVCRDENKVMMEAKVAVSKLLAEYASTNDTTSEDILKAVQELVKTDGITVSWTAPPAIIPADGSNAGSIVGKMELKKQKQSTVESYLTETIDVFILIPQLKVQVQDIIEVPATIHPGEEILLSGTVLPNDATFRMITWEIKDAGNTGATLRQGNLLKATVQGTIIVTAIVEQGSADNKPFCKDFKITVLPEGTYGIRYILNGGVNHPENPDYFDDACGVKLKEPTREGYLFRGWYLDDRFIECITEIAPGAQRDMVLFAAWKHDQKTEAPLADFEDEVTLEIGTEIRFSCETEGSFIMYTLDGTDPGWDNGFYYSSPIVLNKNLTIKAIALNGDYCDSDIVTYHFYLKDNQLIWGDVLEQDQINYESADQIPEGFWVRGVEDAVYTGKPITMTSVRVYYHKTLLTEKVDYTVKYSNNIKAGTGNIILTGKGNYTGALWIPFEIQPLSLEDAQFTRIELAYKAGVVQKGKVVLTYEKDGKKITLKNGTDYTCEYPGTDPSQPGYRPGNFSEEGTYRILVRGKGNYAGELKVEEVITKATLMKTLSYSVKGCGYRDGEPNLPSAITVKAKKVELVGLFAENEEEANRLLQDNDRNDQFDYVYYCSEHWNAGNGKITFLGNVHRGYFGTVTKTYPITGKKLSSCKVMGFQTSIQYQKGKETLQKNLYLSEKEYTLIPGKDYEVEYLNNVAVGTATILITGRGIYSGTIKKTFKVTGKDLKKAYFSAIPVQTYWAEPITPVPTLSFDGTALKGIAKADYEKLESDEEKLKYDYFYSYTNNEKVGSAKIMLTGINECSGKITKSFTINRFNLADSNYVIREKFDPSISGRVQIVAPARKEYEKGGAQLIPEIYFRIGEKGTSLQKLELNRDFTVKYTNHSRLGEATLTITGKGNFAGSLSVDYEVVQKDLKEVQISIEDIVAKPVAKLCKPKIDLVDTNGKKLAAKLDYNQEIKYTYGNDCMVWQGSIDSDRKVYRSKGDSVDDMDIVPVGTEIIATISGCGMYKGKVEKSFRYVSTSISSAKVAPIPKKMYTGYPIELSKSELKISVGGVLLDSKDYEILEYRNNVKKGTATVKIHGIGKYGGTKTIKFNIIGRSF